MPSPLRCPNNKKRLQISATVWKRLKKSSTEHGCGRPPVLRGHSHEPLGGHRHGRRPTDRPTPLPPSLPTDPRPDTGRPCTLGQPGPGPPMQTLTDQSISLLCFHYVSPWLVRAALQSNATVVTVKEQYLETHNATFQGPGSQSAGCQCPKAAMRAGK